MPEPAWIDVHGPVHYREWDGPRDRPTFVLVHGLGGSLLTWSLVAPGLAAHGRVLALDLAGFGRTPSAGRPADVGSNRRLLAGFLRAMDLPPVVLVGNSMGGMISLLQCAIEPESVGAMILVDPVVPRVLTDGRISLRVALGFLATASRRLGPRIVRSRARALGPEGLVRDTLAACVADPDAIDPGLVAAMVDQLAEHRGAEDDAIMAFVEATRSLVDTHVRATRYREMVRGIRQPALVLHGALDRLVPTAAVRRAVEGHDTWTLHVLPGVGHLPQMEAPQRWLSLATSWLDETRTRLDAACVPDSSL